MSLKVSLIVPVYNVEDYLDACMTSIAEQTHQNLEVILIDDASPDGSGALCDEWAARDPRFVSIRQAENAGSSVARNKGLDLATGSYVAFVDSDDLLAPTFVEHLLELALDNDADIVVSGLTEFGDTPPRFTEGTPSIRLSAREALQQIVLVKPRWAVWGKLYIRELFAAGLRFPVGLLHQDLHLIPRIFERAATVVLNDDALYAYRQRVGSVMDQRRRHSRSVDLLTVLDENIQFANTHTTDDAERQRYVAAYVLHASEQLEQMALGSEWRRNKPFRRAYVVFVRKHLGAFTKSRHVSPGYRALVVLSAVSPIAFKLAFACARTLKRSVVPRLSRHTPGRQV